jgi:hypothetical protein
MAPAVLAAEGIRILASPPQAPKANAICETGRSPGGERDDAEPGPGVAAPVLDVDQAAEAELGELLEREALRLAQAADVQAEGVQAEVRGRVLVDTLRHQQRKNCDEIISYDRQLDILAN